MAVQMLQQWNGLAQWQVYTLDSGEESRLISAGLARNWTGAAIDGASVTPLVGRAQPGGGLVVTDGGEAVFALSEAVSIQTLTATGTARTGAGEYRGFVVRAISGTPQTVTVYDATSATGTPIHTESVTATGYFPWAGNARRPLTTGCHVVISGGTLRTIDVLVGA